MFLHIAVTARICCAMVCAADVVATLAGAWYLVNSTYNGKPDYNQALGNATVGLLQYTANGYMAANIMATEPQYRPTDLTYPAPPDNDTLHDSEWALIAKHILTYAGPFSIEPMTDTTGQITHGPLTAAHLPSLVGKKQLRNYSVEDGGQILHVRAWSTNGDVGDLVWRRMKDIVF